MITSISIITSYLVTDVQKKGPNWGKFERFFLRRFSVAKLICLYLLHLRLFGRWVNTGHGSKGWTYCWGSASLLAQLITGQVCIYDVANLIFLGGYQPCLTTPAKPQFWSTISKITSCPTNLLIFRLQEPAIKDAEERFSPLRFHPLRRRLGFQMSI